MALLASPFIALVPAMSSVLDRGGVSTQMGTAILVTAQGVGRGGGGARASHAGRAGGPADLLASALFVLPVLLVLYGVAPTLWLSAAAFLAVGGGYIAVLSGLNTVVQLRAPAEVRGRILSIYMMGLGIVYPIGAVVQGTVANHTGVRTVTVTRGPGHAGGHGHHRPAPPGRLQLARGPRAGSMAERQRARSSRPRSCRDLAVRRAPVIAPFGVRS